MRIPGGIRKIGVKLKGIIMRLFLLRRVLSRREKSIFWIAFLALVVAGTIKFTVYYRSITKEVPSTEGAYIEGLVGQPEFLNPVLAKSDNDKTVNSLLYNGLVSLDRNNQIIPDLASSWDITPDQKSYTMHLKTDVTFHDGSPFTSDDVRYTYSLIQDQSQKSPYYNDFKDVLIETPDKNTVKLTLKTPYGPFLTNLAVGIIPGGRTLADLDSHPLGTGKYQYQSSEVRSGKVDKLILERNDNYYGGHPYIRKVTFQFFPTIREANNYFDQEEISSVPLDHPKAKANTYQYDTAGQVLLIFNERIAPFSDKNLRVAVKTEQVSTNGQAFDILVTDNSDLIKTADSYKDKLNKLGYKPNIVVLKDKDFQDRMAKKDFAALIVGIDFGHDFDPYSLWHSSQEAVGTNIAGFNNKGGDIILEEARQVLDSKARQAKYDQFNQLLDSEAARVVLETKKFYFEIDDEFRDVTLDGALTPSEHLRDINGWYSETKRVKK